MMRNFWTGSLPLAVPAAFTLVGAAPALAEKVQRRANDPNCGCKDSTDSETRNQAMMGGQPDYSGLTRDPLYEGNPDLAVRSFPSGGWFGIAFPAVRRPPPDHPRVRKAVLIAVDRQAVPALLTGGPNGVVTCFTPVAATAPFRAGLSCTQDIAGARVLPAEAGHPDGIDVDVRTADLEPGTQQFAEVFQQQVWPAGIRVNLVLAPSDGHGGDVRIQQNAVVPRGNAPSTGS